MAPTRVDGQSVGRPERRSLFYGDDVKKAILLAGQDPEIDAVVAAMAVAREHFKTEIMFLEKQAKLAKTKHDEAEKALWLELEKRLKEKWLPKDYSSKTHCLQLDTNAGVLFYFDKCDECGDDHTSSLKRFLEGLFT